MMNTHPELEQLSALIDGELNEREQITLEAHIAGCAECARTLRALRATLADLSALEVPVLSETDSWSIRTALAKERKLSGRSRRWAWAGGAVAAAVIGLLGYVVATHTGSSSKSTEGAQRDSALGVESDLTTQDANALVRSVAGGTAGGAGTTDEAYGLSAGSAPAPAPMAADARKAGDATPTLSPERSLASCTKALQDSKHRSAPIQTGLARFNHEPVYLIFFEFPAKQPERVELWIVARSNCEVRYFTQAKTHS